MRELAVKLGVVCGILMMLALFMSVNTISSHKKSADLSLEISQNTSIHISEHSRIANVQLVSADPEFTGSVSEDESYVEPRAMVKFSSGWSVNRTNKSAMLVSRH